MADNQKLDVFRTVSEAYGTTFGNLKALVRLSWVPIIIALVLYYVTVFSGMFVGPPRIDRFLLSYPLLSLSSYPIQLARIFIGIDNFIIWFALLVFFERWQRFVFLGPDQFSKRRFGAAFKAYSLIAIWSLVICGLVLISYMALEFCSWVAGYVGYLSLIGNPILVAMIAVWFFVRTCLLVPNLSATNTFEFWHSCKLANGNLMRLTAILGFSFLPLSALFFVIGQALESAFWLFGVNYFSLFGMGVASLLYPILKFSGFAVGAASLALAYKVLSPSARTTTVSTHSS